ncbi:ATP-binding cassette domain-containing protein [Leucobacter sp. USHLN153]|uniref:ATP-binding cassette domain-containing protein n=1 Tax=Leucobacter sp. USHLN153 TaxID=3081268 RepID=UPI003017AE85
MSGVHATLRRAGASPAFIAGAILTALLLIVAFAAPLLAPHSPTEQQLTGGLLPPSAEHWFGTDQLGRDVLSRMLYAARVDLGVAALAALAPFVIGLTVGLLSGYFGGAVDWVASRVTDTVIAFPFYVIVIALVFALGAGAGGIVVAFALVGWVGYARVIRAMTASLRESGWVRSARGAGLSHARVLLRHVLPNVLPQAVVLLATEIVLIMVAIVTLGYLGLGIRPPTPDWGTMIADAQQFITTQWWLAALPGLAVVLTGIALSLLGDGIGDVLRVGDRRGRAGRGLARGPGRTADGRRAGGRVGSARGARVRRGDGAVFASRGEHGRADVPVGAVRVRGLQIERADGTALVGGAVVAGGAVLAEGAVLEGGAVLSGADIADGVVLHGGARREGSSTAGAIDAGSTRAGSAAPGIELDVSPGGALGIVGESGSGKSLTLRALLGMLPPGLRATGHISVGGRVGMVFQDSLTALDPLTRVGTQLREAVEAASCSDDSVLRSRGSAAIRVRELLEAVQLLDTERIARSYPHELSGGQRQRVVIALALASDPALLLCDEPTTALDVTVQREILALLSDLRSERGLTLVFVSHDLAVVAQMCEELVVMAGGAVVETGFAREVIRTPRSPEARALIDSVPRLPALGSSAPPAAAESEPASAPASSSAPAPAPAPASAPPPAPTPSSSLTPASSSAGVAAVPLLEVRGARVQYRSFAAVSGASFELSRGEAVGIVGESGSGKTTLARAIAGQLELSSGEILLDGALLSSGARGDSPRGASSASNARSAAGRRGAHGRRRTAVQLRDIQLVPQDPYSSLTPRRTVGSMLEEVLRATERGNVKLRSGRNRSKRGARVGELLELVRLDPDLATATPDRLSGGQRQRVAIARALAAEPRVLVADEPTSALDVSVQASVVVLLQQLRRELGLALVFVSHDLAVVHELCDRVLVMRGGVVVESGGSEFFTAPQSDYGRALLEAVPRLELSRS